MKSTRNGVRRALPLFPAEFFLLSARAKLYLFTGKRFDSVPLRYSRHREDSVLKSTGKFSAPRIRYPTRKSTRLKRRF